MRLVNWKSNFSLELDRIVDLFWIADKALPLVSLGDLVHELETEVPL